MDPLLLHFIRLAEEAHRGQLDKGGEPYIEHPRRVMAAVDSLEEKLAAILHDVVEDTAVTVADLVAQGLPENVAQAVDALTKRDGEDYEVYLSRVTRSRVALVVKIADMTDNMDARRMPNPGPKDLERLAKYQRTLPRLQAALRNFGK